MEWFSISARGHHGYPQPEDNFQETLYSEVCLRCGIHGTQASPFRIRRSNKAAYSHFLQLNWVFDVFFVTPEVRDSLLASSLVGMDFQPVLDHKSGSEQANRIQLLINTHLACAETSRLQTVTCRPDNEEPNFVGGGQLRYPPDTPYCNRIKHHPPTSIAIRLTNEVTIPDIFHTEEWFGSGGSAFRLTLCSEAFKNLVQKHKWRGLSFIPVALDGFSDRVQ